MIMSNLPRRSRGVLPLLLAVVLPAAAQAGPSPDPDARVPEAVRAYVAKNLAPGQVIGPQGAGLANDIGFAVAVNERYAVIGVPSGSLISASPTTGVAYVYERVNGAAPFALRGIIGPNATTDPVSLGDERFGESVAIAGTTIVVGAPQDTDDPTQTARVGSAYVYLQPARGGQFQFATKLTASSAQLAVGGAQFGRSVSIAEGHIVVGAPGADDGATNSGAAAVYSCSRFPAPACTFRGKLLPGDPRASALFGTSVSITFPPKSAAAAVVVGAPGQCAATCPLTAGPQGAAYAYFVPATGPLGTGAKFFASDAAPGDAFGFAVSADGISAAVGAPNDDGTGTVRVFTRTPGGFVFDTRLAPGGADPMRFGAAVSLFRNHLAIGAPNRTISTPARIGSTFVFERGRGQWFRRDEIFRTAGFTPLQSDVQYGASVALGGGVLLVGEPEGPGATAGIQGRAYVYLTGRSAKIARVANPNAVAPTLDRYGTDVAVSGGFMAVGLPHRESGATPNVGEVRLYQQAAGGGWAPTNQSAIMFPEAALANARFGHAVAFTENASHLIVGAPGASAGAGGNAGAVFVFERQGSAFLPAVQRPKLTRPNAMAGDDFGAAVDVSPSANLLIVGAPEASGGMGGVTIFRDAGAPAPKSGKVGQAKFDDGGNVPPPPGGGIGDKWGSSVATDGDQAVAGAPETGAGGDGGDGYATVIDEGAGGEYVNTDTVDAPPDAGPGDEQDFGAAVDIDDGMLAVGAPGTDMPDGDEGDMNPDEGAAYAYDVAGEPPQASEPTTLDQPGGDFGDKWGSSVGVDEGGVGAGGPGTDVPGDSGNSADQGAVSTYECYVNENGLVVCEHDETLFGKDAQADEAIGSSLDMENGEIVLGAPDAGAGDEGAVYVSEDLFAIDGLFRDGFE